VTRHAQKLAVLKIWLCLLGCHVCWQTSLLAQGLPRVSPESVGFDVAKLGEIQGLVTVAIEAGKLPGCVVAVGHRGRLVFLQSFGRRQVEPVPLPMTVETVFDLASLTKPVATATCMMRLVEQGRVSLTGRVSNYCPEFGARGKEELTLFDLLTHQSGLIADNPLSDYQGGSVEAWKNICDLPLQSPARTRFIYSDVNFIALGKVIEAVSGRSLADFSQQEIFEPLGMCSTRFCPPTEWSDRIAPTGKRDGHWIIGEVHDPRAHLMGGVAGHAGLFSNAEDLAIYAQMLINGGTCNDRRILSENSVTQMTRGYMVPTSPNIGNPLLSSEPRTDAGTLRGLGWDRQSRYSHNRGQGWSMTAFGHGGFTGTVLWIDPERELFYLLLSNRLHPTGKGEVNKLAGQIGTLIIEAMPRPD
jgi:CubicO group peptidase (beta-lactamase class C family)